VLICYSTDNITNFILGWWSGILWWGYGVGVCVWQCGNKIVRWQGRLSKLNCKSMATNSSFSLLCLPHCVVAFYFCIGILIPCVLNV